VLLVPAKPALAPMVPTAAAASATAHRTVPMAPTIMLATAAPFVVLSKNFFILISPFKFVCRFGLLSGLAYFEPLLASTADITSATTQSTDPTVPIIIPIILISPFLTMYFFVVS